MTKGYTFKEMMKFGFYDWTIISIRKATKAESKNWVGCDYYEECPCCNCGESIATVQTYARPRWSKSGKRMVEDVETRWVCVAHA